MTLPSSNRLVFDLTFVEDSFNEMEGFMQQKENLMRFLLVASRRFSHVQDSAIQLAYVRLVENAEGQFLTDLAARLGIPRGDQNDNQLQAYIKFRALSQASEGTRTDIVKLLQIVSGGEYVKIFKGGNNYVEVTFASECLNLAAIGGDLEDLFPVNTNLLMTNIITGTKPMGVGWDDGGVITKSDKIGVLGWDGLAKNDETGHASTIIISSK
jgi:hypothetical protein